MARDVSGALVAAGSALVGALIGAAAGYFGVQSQVSAQDERAVRDQRIAAYSAVLSDFPVLADAMTGYLVLVEHGKRPEPGSTDEEHDELLKSVQTGYGHVTVVEMLGPGPVRKAVREFSESFDPLLEAINICQYLLGGGTGPEWPDIDGLWEQADLIIDEKFQAFRDAAIAELD